MVVFHSQNLPLPLPLISPWLFPQNLFFFSFPFLSSLVLFPMRKSTIILIWRSLTPHIPFSFVLLELNIYQFNNFSLPLSQFSVRSFFASKPPWGDNAWCFLFFAPRPGFLWSHHCISSLADIQPSVLFSSSDFSLSYSIFNFSFMISLCFSIHSSSSFSSSVLSNFHFVMFFFFLPMS